MNSAKDERSQGAIVSAPSGFRAPLTLHLEIATRNGNDRASSAKVWLNGQLLFGTSAFSQQVPGYDVEVGLTDPLTLEVWVAVSLAARRS